MICGTKTDIMRFGYPLSHYKQYDCRYEHSPLNKKIGENLHKNLHNRENTNSTNKDREPQKARRDVQTPINSVTLPNNDNASFVPVRDELRCLLSIDEPYNLYGSFLFCASLY